MCPTIDNVGVVPSVGMVHNEGRGFQIEGGIGTMVSTLKNFLGFKCPTFDVRQNNSGRS